MMHSDLFLFHFLDVSMTIPQGAIPEGQRSEIFLAVSRDDKDRPKLTGEHLLLSFPIYLFMDILF